MERAKQSWKDRREEAEIRDKLGDGEREGKKTAGPSQVIKVKNTRMGRERPYLSSITTTAALEVARTDLATEENVYYS